MSKIGLKEEGLRRCVTHMCGPDSNVPTYLGPTHDKRQEPRGGGFLVGESPT